MVALWLPEVRVPSPFCLVFTERVWRAVAQEFSDLNDVSAITRVVLRLVMAAALGGALGYQRAQSGKSAGVRTHMLVSMGAALFVLIPEQAGASVNDLSRVVQGVVAGVGFLGAGAILRSDDAREARGLTTAAGIWLTAAIGVSVGLGREATALVSTVLAWVVLALIPKAKRTHGQQGTSAD